jgi:sugar/nucleoside kinase (ribokinase family)
MAGIDYLVIGHVCEDLTPEGPALGGTAAFAAVAAQALGLRVGVVTSAPDCIAALLGPLGSTALVRVPAEQATRFTNIYGAQGRGQILSGRAAPLELCHVPTEWRSAPIVHLAPVADELGCVLVDAFPLSLVGATPQGWLRSFDERGRVSVRRWPEAPRVLGRARAVVLSIEDLGNSEQLAQSYAALARLLVVTRGARGCTLYAAGRRLQIAAPARTEVDPTGAGDVFAAAWFARLHRGDDPEAAARFATELAADFVTRPRFEGLPGSPTL